MLFISAKGSTRVVRIVIDEEKCTGCRVCEIACSYHHKKIFDPQISSIEVYPPGKGEILSTVVHRRGGKSGHLPCDQCAGEDQPLCLKYCDWDAIDVV